MLLNSKLFNQISYFMGGSKEVKSLESGARENGGATQFKNGIVSNIETGNFINISEKMNTLRLFIPSTLKVNDEINNAEYVKKFYNMIESKYENNTITVLPTKGSWYSETIDKVVIEKITIIELNINKVTESDINFFLDLGLQVKEMMSQDAVSVMINNSLCLV